MALTCGHTHRMTPTHSHTHILIGPVPDTQHYWRIWLYWRSVSTLIAYSADPTKLWIKDRGKGGWGGVAYTHTPSHTHTPRTYKLVQRTGCMKQTRPEKGKRTSSGILDFNYSKWHFLGTTIRDGCLFPGFSAAGVFFFCLLFSGAGGGRVHNTFVLLKWDRNDVRASSEMDSGVTSAPRRFWCCASRCVIVAWLKQTLAGGTIFFIHPPLKLARQILHIDVVYGRAECAWKRTKKQFGGERAQQSHCGFSSSITSI